MAAANPFSNELASLFQNSLSPDHGVRKAAESELFRLESFDKAYAITTLFLTRREDLSTDIHLAAAIAFKNYIKKHWHYDENSEQSDKIGEEQRSIIKVNITAFMLNSPSHIQLQLSEVISFIGGSDFPEKWPNLIHELRDKIISEEQNYNIIQGVLHTAHSIFVSYRHKLQSDQLWSEIKLVIEHFAPPLTDKFKKLTACAKNLQDPEQLKLIYQSILLCVKIYHDLVSQDLPDYFEERVNDWLPIFLELLTVQQNIKSAPGLIEDLKAEICEIASLFVQRYADIENFQEYTQKFAQNIWNLLVTTDQDIQYDSLVCTAIRFLVTVAERPESRSLFQDANVLNLLCQRVIIPNLTFRVTDEELFEDDPDGYIAKEVSGQDIYSRRQTACNLVQSLGKFQEVELINVFGNYIEEMLKSYESNKGANWKHKDLAIFLYSAMAIKGSTREYGTVSISQHVNVEKFFEENIVSELANDTNFKGSNILRVDSLRYIDLFRNHISLNTLIARLPLIFKHIKSHNVVVRAYACLTLEKLLTMRDPAQPRTTALKSEHFESCLPTLVASLFEALDKHGSLENEHIMKAIMRLFAFSKPAVIVQFLPSVVPKLTTKLGIVARNPSKPYFNHYLFETLALTIRAACSSNNSVIRDEFEKVLFNMLEVVVAQDVQEFTPYVLQLLNLLLRNQAAGSVSESFTNLFQQLLSPTFWERPANIPPLTEITINYVNKMGRLIISQNKFIPLLGIFQKLISSKATDHEGLALLQAIMLHMPQPEVDARISDIFMLIFQRLTGSKTPKFVKNVLVCFSLYAFVRGPEVLASAINQLQDKMFSMVLEKLYVADVKKVTNYIDRRICLCGMIKILSQLPLIDNGFYNNMWAPMLLVIMEIFELPQQNTNDDQDYFIDVTETLDFEAKYSKLIYSSSKRDDPTKDIGDMKSLLATSLANLSTKVPGFVPGQLQTLDQGVAACLSNYCQVANVNIS